MRYIVTGVDGKVCRRIAEEMISSVDPHDLIFTCPSLANLNPQSKEFWEESGISLREANYNDVESMKRAFEGGDRIFIISSLDVKKRVQQHKNAIDAAIAAGVQHITYPGISDDRNEDEVFKDNYVAPDHIATGAYLRLCRKTKNLRYTIMRPNLYMENYTTAYAMMALMMGNKWYCVANDGKATFVPKDDVGRSYAAALLGKVEDYKTYMICGRESVSIKEICQMVSEESGINLEYRHVSKEEYQNKLAEINVPRFIDGDFSKSPVPFCAEDLATNDACVEKGLNNFKSDDVEQLTGRKPLSAREVVKNSSYIWEQNIKSWREMR